MRAPSFLARLRGRGRSLASARLTRRGTVVLAAGAALAVLGVTLGLPDLVGLGVAGWPSAGSTVAVAPCT